MPSRTSSLNSLRKSRTPDLPSRSPLERFHSVPYEETTRQETASPTLSEATTSSLPRQERAKVDPPPRQNDAAIKSMEALEADSEANYQPKSLGFWMVMLALYLSLFVVALDRTIISVAIPEITDEFQSLDDVGWYGSAYMITGAAFSLMFGKIYKHYSVKSVFLVTLVLFEIGSLICGAAPNSVTLIIGRAVAGLGSSGIFTGGMMVVVPLIPLRKRPLYYGMFGAIFGIASVLGPFLGGAFTNNVSWRWCFYINLPIGAFTILSIVLFLHVKPPPPEKLTFRQQIARLDPAGTLLFIPSIVCLVLALQWGGSKYSWSSGTTIGLLVACGLLFAGFWMIQIATPRTATVPLRIVTQRSILSGAVFIFLLNGSLFTIVYFLPIWFQAVKGDAAIRAGINLFPLVISLTVMSVIAGGFTQRVGYYTPPILVSPILTTVGAALLAQLQTTSTSSKWIGYQALYGFGTGMAMQTTNMAAQTVLERPDISTGMALNFFAQNLGGAIFVPVAQAIFENLLQKNLSGVPGIDLAKLSDSGVLTLGGVVPPQYMPDVRQGFNSSITKCIYVSVALSAASLLPALTMEWRNIKVGAERKAKEISSELECEKGSSNNDSNPKRGSRLRAEYWQDPAKVEEKAAERERGASEEEPKN